MRSSTDTHAHQGTRHLENEVSKTKHMQVCPIADGPKDPTTIARIGFDIILECGFKLNSIHKTGL